MNLLDKLFIQLINIIQEQLHLKPLIQEFTEISFIIKDKIENTNDPFNMGVEREFINGKLYIEINARVLEFLSIIILREAYRLFIPESFQDNINIQFLIYMIIELELENAPIIQTWRMKIREYDVYIDLFKNKLDTLIKFFKLEDPESKQTIIPFFFHYIRGLNVVDDKLLDKMGYEFIETMKAFLREEDTLDTIRILRKIFYSVKSYHALLDYQEIFKEMKEKGGENLSIRKFVNNVRMLNRHSFCAPTYQLDWSRINLLYYIVFIRFHPSLDWFEINEFIKNFPFFLWPRNSALSLSIEIFGYMIIPGEYNDDLQKSLNYLRKIGYIINYSIYLVEEYRHWVNLNYLRKEVDETQFVFPTNKIFRKDFILDFKLEYSNKEIKKKLDLLDFLILDRVRGLSGFTGFGFERRESTISDLKTDLLDEISYESNKYKRFKEQVNKFQNSQILKNSFLEFLDINKKEGFFLLLNKLNATLKISKILDEKNKKKWRNQRELISLLLNNLTNFEDILILKDKSIMRGFINNVIPLFLRSKEQFKREIEKIELFHSFLESCNAIKLYNLNSIERIIRDFELSSIISQTKEKKLELIYNESKFKEITSKEIESKLDEFSSAEPPVLKPNLINSITLITYKRQFLMLFIIYSLEAIEALESMCLNFPHFYYQILNNLYLGTKVIYCEIGIPYLDMKERYQLLSILYNYFGKDIFIINRFLHPGIYPSFSRKNFYDFLNNKFVYIGSLFEQFKVFSRNIFGNRLPSIKEEKSELYQHLWLKDKNILEFMKKINQKRYREKPFPNNQELRKLSKFNNHLKQSLENPQLFSKIKRETFYSDYIKSIKYRPNLKKFGFQQYYLYIQLSEADAIDFRLLLLNSFQSVKFCAQSNVNISFLIRYIFPKNTPNIAYLNWLTLSKKIVNEFILFTKKKTINQIDIHNITPNGWDFDINKFKSYIKNIISKVPYSNESEIHEDDFTRINDQIPESPLYKDLVLLYGTKSLNLKKILQTKKSAPVESIILNFLKKNLITPYVKLKNLQLRERFIFIIPNLTPIQTQTLIKVFKFFDVVDISPIEGMYFIHSFSEVKKFENGLYIKLFLPIIEIESFIEIFALIFKYLNVKHYLINSDFYDGSKFVENVNRDIKPSYNPLKNFKWNKLDKIWQNWKLFGEKFEYLYPPLVIEDIDEEKNREL